MKLKCRVVVQAAGSRPGKYQPCDLTVVLNGWLWTGFFQAEHNEMSVQMWPRRPGPNTALVFRLPAALPTTRPALSAEAPDAPQGREGSAYPPPSPDPPWPTTPMDVQQGHFRQGPLQGRRDTLVHTDVQKQGHPFHPTASPPQGPGCGRVPGPRGWWVGEDQEHCTCFGPSFSTLAKASSVGVLLKDGHPGDHMGKGLLVFLRGLRDGAEEELSHSFSCHAEATVHTLDRSCVEK